MSVTTPRQPGTQPDEPGRGRTRPGLLDLTTMGRLESPLTSYYLVLGTTVALTLIGLIMVLSSSSVESLRDSGSSFTVFGKQAVFALLALPCAFVASRLSVRAWKALGWPMILVSILGLALVLSPLGHGTHGNRNWIVIAGFTLQPSEGAKLALVVWGAAVLARKRALLDRFVHVLVPVVVPVAALVLGLVLKGHDLGTALILLFILGSLLWIAGVPRRFFLAGALSAGILVMFVVRARSNRLERIDAWLSGACSAGQEYLNTCWQPVHGKWALASGGWWGLGLGESREKWSWLPEAHNDFIFAILGEELGLAGALVVLGLFALLGIGLFRVVARSDDAFVKIATGGVMAWVLGQAVINIGAVVGLLPVVGVPLPLVSSGGSALVTTLIGLGMVIGFARREAGAQDALTAHAALVKRSLAVLPGRSLRVRPMVPGAMRRGHRTGGR